MSETNPDTLTTDLISEIYKNTLSGNSYLLAHENCDEFKRLKKAYTDDLVPLSTSEHALIHRLALSEWRFSRLAIMERILYDGSLTNPAPDLAAATENFKEHRLMLNTVNKEMARCDRIFFSTYRYLKKLNEQRYSQRTDNIKSISEKARLIVQENRPAVWDPYESKLSISPVAKVALDLVADLPDFKPDPEPPKEPTYPKLVFINGLDNPSVTPTEDICQPAKDPTPPPAPEYRTIHPSECTYDGQPVYHSRNEYNITQTKPKGTGLPKLQDLDDLLRPYK